LDVLSLASASASLTTEFCAYLLHVTAVEQAFVAQHAVGNLRTDVISLQNFFHGFGADLNVKFSHVVVACVCNIFKQRKTFHASRACQLSRTYNNLVEASTHKIHLKRTQRQLFTSPYLQYGKHD